MMSPHTLTRWGGINDQRTLPVVQAWINLVLTVNFEKLRMVYFLLSMIFQNDMKKVAALLDIEDDYNSINYAMLMGTTQYKLWDVDFLFRVV